MKLPRLTRSGLLLAVLVSAVALKAQTTAMELNRLGAADRRAGHCDAAIADFTKAIALKPDYAAAYNNRGAAKLAKRDIDGAMADFTKATELDPRHKIGVINLASARKLKERFPHGALGAEDEAVFARQEREIQSAVDALSQPPPPDK